MTGGVSRVGVMMTGVGVRIMGAHGMRRRRIAVDLAASSSAGAPPITNAMTSEKSRFTIKVEYSAHLCDRHASREVVTGLSDVALRPD